MRIDPFIQQGAKLVSTDESGKGKFGKCGVGHCVALSEDGNTALIPGSDGEQGGKETVWVFARSGATWAFQARLVRSGAESGGPPAVALWADGNTALLGDPEYREGGLSGLGAALGCSPARATRGRSREEG